MTQASFSWSATNSPSGGLSFAFQKTGGIQCVGAIHESPFPFTIKYYGENNVPHNKSLHAGYKLLCYNLINKGGGAMSKRIKDQYELRKVLRNARLWFVGSFMNEFIDKREMWENPETKSKFIAYIYNEYCCGIEDISTTIASINAVIRIVESDMVVQALNLVLKSKRVDDECSESKINAKWTLNMINNGEIKL